MVDSLMKVNNQKNKLKLVILSNLAGKVGCIYIHRERANPKLALDDL